MLNSLLDENTLSPPSSVVTTSDSSDLSTLKTAERVKKLEERLEDKISRMQ